MACPQCQSPLIVELESNPDGEEVQVSAPGAPLIEDVGVSEMDQVVAETNGEDEGGVVGEEMGEVARISWIERPVSIAKDVPTEESPVGN